MTYSELEGITTAEMAKAVADEGWDVVGVLGRPLFSPSASGGGRGASPIRGAGPPTVSLPRIPRQLLGDKTVDPFYWASGELPLDPGSTTSSISGISSNP
jgi:hypothetical protein